MELKGRRVCFAGIKNYYKVTVITVWSWHKDRQRPMEQNRSPETEPCIYGHLFMRKVAEQWRKVVFAIPGRLIPDELEA